MAFTFHANFSFNFNSSFNSDFAVANGSSEQRTIIFVVLPAAF
jgi:hypothetical protein